MVLDRLFWIEKSSDEVFDYTVPNNTLSRAALNYEHGSTKNIHYGDVLTKYNAIVDAQKAEIPFITGKGTNEFRKSMLQDGDIIIADTAEDESAGKATEVVNVQGSNVVAGLHTIVCRARTKMALGYFGYYLNTNAYHDQLLPLMQGIKVLSLSKSNLKKTKIRFPKSTNEQRKIATSLIMIDRLISLHQRKRLLLESLKSAVLNNSFPEATDTTPRIRFSKYTDPWDSRRISSQYEKVTEKNDLSVGKDRIISVANMYFKGNDGNQSSDDYMKTYNVFRIGDIAFEGHKSKGFAFGRFVENTIGTGIVSHVFDVFRPITDYDPAYWKYAIHNEKLMRPILAKSTTKATMMNNLVAKDFLKRQIKVPSIDEQSKIGKLLVGLDIAIKSQEMKISKLYRLKSSLLDSLFI